MLNKILHETCKMNALWWRKVLSVPHLFLGLLHQAVLVSTGVKLSQQVSVDELLRLTMTEEVTWLMISRPLFVCVCVGGGGGSYVVDPQVHDGLRDEVPDGAGDDSQVRVHQVPDDLHLSLQLRVHTVDVSISTRFLHLNLHKHGSQLTPHTPVQTCYMHSIPPTPPHW